MAVLLKIDDIEKRRFYEAFQAFHRLQSFFGLTVTTAVPPASVGLKFFSCTIEMTHQLTQFKST